MYKVHFVLVYSHVSVYSICLRQSAINKCSSTPRVRLRCRGRRKPPRGHGGRTTALTTYFYFILLLLTFYIFVNKFQSNMKYIFIRILFLFLCICAILYDFEIKYGICMCNNSVSCIILSLATTTCQAATCDGMAVISYIIYSFYCGWVKYKCRALRILA